MTDKMAVDRKWSGIWIRPEMKRNGDSQECEAAPWVRKSFQWNGEDNSVFMYIACPGYHEVYINGMRPDDRVLSPTPMQFSQHIPYIKYDIKSLLNNGQNEIKILLGNGWFNCFTSDAWKFRYANWRIPTHEPVKLLLDIQSENKNIVSSSCDWEFAPSPIIYNSLRNGEHYDAREELSDIKRAWQPVVPSTPPPGILVKEDLEPCKIQTTFKPHCIVYSDQKNNVTVYKFSVNLTGWVKINVSGYFGEVVKIRYGERINTDGSLDQEHIAKFIYTGQAQEDKYILKGGEVEVWSPRFTYHGFQYAEVTLSSDVKLNDIEACFIHNDFKSAGAIETDDNTLNQLQAMTVQSYLSNFTGIPTDCPHREKNGWTGDAQLAAETGLWNYDAYKAYLHYLQLVIDTQDPVGTFCSIAPSSGFGRDINPAWDMAVFEIPYQLYKYYNNTTAINMCYDSMKKYLLLCENSLSNGILQFGLGDWACPDKDAMTPRGFTSTANYLGMLDKFCLFSKINDENYDYKYFKKLSEQIKESINSRFNLNNIWADDSVTAIATAIYFDISKKPNEDCHALVEKIEEMDFKSYYGILGAKYIPRVLSEYGYLDEAYNIITQPEFPGFGNWVRKGYTTLLEGWVEKSSLNHIMFGDVSARMFEYIAGIKASIDCPGFKEFNIKPGLFKKVKKCSAFYKSIHGDIKINWFNKNTKFKLNFVVPEGTKANITLPDKTCKRFSSGQYSISCDL